MIGHLRQLLAAGIAAACLAPGAAYAQTPPAAPPAPAATETTPSGMRFTIGGTVTTLRGDCGECGEVHGIYLHTGGILADVTFLVHPRMEAGVEVFYVPVTTAAGDHVRATSLLAMAEYRPWESRGFFLKVGMGVAFVRNFIYVPVGDSPPFTSKALGVTYGVGWTFQPKERVGLQVFGLQHVAALGDLVTSTSTIQNVVANFWSAGAAIVIR